MGFRINNNITALIAQGNLQKNQNSLTTSIERLSSGLRINRGADDAAGLTISEKLRGQIRGLNRAMLNAQDGISLIQTAEGALNENASILNRMRELAVQSSNDTLTTNDRLEIQKEIDQLVDEIDRIALTTEFNTKKLLDGTATAIVTSNEEGIRGLQVGSTRASAGDYVVEINLSTPGAREEQASNILRLKEGGELVTLDSKLGNIDSFYDNEGNNILRDPVQLTLRGNSSAASLTISSDVSINELVENIETLIRRPKNQGGLNIEGTDVSFDADKGQIYIKSGKEGTSGEISFSTDEDLIKAFGFQQVFPSADPAYRATAIQQGVSTPIQATASTTTDRFSGVIPGIDLQFSPPTSAQIEAKFSPEKIIRTGDSPIIFEFADTDAEVTESRRSDIVRVSLPANRSFTLTSIQTIINDSVRVGYNVLTRGANVSIYSYGGSDNTYTAPSIRASFQGDNLVLTSGMNGSSAKISIFNANSAAVNVLGVQNGTFNGERGENARIIGTKDIGNGTNIGSTNLQISITGPDGRVVNNIFFQANSNVSTISLTSTINNSLRAANIKVESHLDANGNLVIQSLEDGEDTSIKLNAVSGNINDLGVVNGASANGRGGIPANFIGKTNTSFSELGYTFDNTLAFELSDQYGARSGLVVFGSDVSITAANASTFVATSNNITMSQTSIAAVLNASDLKTTDIGFDFDAAGRLRFKSKSVGQDARILMQSRSPLSIPGISASGGVGNVSLFSPSTSQTTVLSSFGIDGSQVATGAGRTKYTVHVSDRSFILQIGANENQILESSIANFTSRSLGLDGLDVTSFRSATKALGAIDRAVNQVSSERSKLGSLQNRLTSTVNNLTVTSTNLQAAESRIRDVDVAMETVAFTRNQILIQAGTAQLAQANALPQQALQLLGG